MVILANYPEKENRNRMTTDDHHEKYLDSLLALPKVCGVKVSYDNKWVAWGWFGTAATCEVYFAATDGSTEPQRLTNTAENTYFLAWAPDSKSILVTEDKGGNERNRIFRVWLDKPLELYPLTEENPNYFICGGELHKNSKWLVYGANLDLTTGQEIEPTAIIRHDIATGERIVLACPEKGGFNVPALSPTGERIIYWRNDNHPAGVQLWLVNIDGSEDHEIINVGDDKKVYGVWFTDGKCIAVQAEIESHERIGIWTERDGIKWLLDDSKRQIENIFVPYNNDKIVVQEVYDACLNTTLLDPNTGEERFFPKLPGTLSPIASLANEEWIGTYNSSTQPLDIVRFRMNTQTPNELQSISQVWERTKLKNNDLIAAEDFRWISSDGLSIQGWLYRTKAKVIGTIICVHGGPTSHSCDEINNLIQYLVYRGFNILTPNYRGSTGFGLAFRDKIKEEGWGGMEQIDIRTGIEALIMRGISEAGKVGITGVSYGGYSSWHAITHFPLDIVAAAAPICGMTDLVVDYAMTRPDLRSYGKEMMGGTPEQIPHRYYERSPINFVQNIQGHLLIIQGMQDPNVHPVNVAKVREKLDAFGIKYEVLTFDDEGHGIKKIKNQKILYSELAKFFTAVFLGK